MLLFEATLMQGFKTISPRGLDPTKIIVIG